MSDSVMMPASRPRFPPLFSSAYFENDQKWGVKVAHIIVLLLPQQPNDALVVG
jgi:hypothetical protein